MTFVVTPEQEQLRELVRQFLTKKSASDRVRSLAESPTGFDPLVWKQMAGELGLQGLGIPEQYGGAGFGALELALVFEEMGRALLVAPFFAGVALAAPLLLALDGDAACTAYLPRIADGSLLATVALTETGDDWRLDRVATTATQAGADWRLDGTKTLVLDGHLAELLLVVADTGSGLGVFAVDAASDGLTRTPLESLDTTRRLATVGFDGVRATRVGGDAAAAVAHMLDVAVTALAAEQVGGAGRCLDEAVAYAKVREQFGRPIGSFQVIKHMCADMLMALESARSTAYYAAWAITGNPEEFPQAAAVAKAFCSDTFVEVASQNIQIHGGIGVTWEHDAHLYLRRAKSSRVLFGDPELHRSRLADLVGI